MGSIITVDSDVLAGVQALPDESVDLLILFLSEEDMATREQRVALLHEVVRVLTEDGDLLCDPRLLDDLGEERFSEDFDAEVEALWKEISSGRLS